MMQPQKIIGVTKSLEWAMRVSFALVPLIAITYLARFQDPQALFTDHHFHELAIATAVLLSGFVAYVTWRCYRHAGEPFLHWVALGLTGFTVVYLPHGALTFMANHHPPLFLLYGPASRLVMTGCFLIGLLSWGRPADPPERRHSPISFRLGLALFLAIDLLVALIALSPAIPPQIVRIIWEIGAMALAIAGIGIILLRRIDTPLMWFYTVALAAFAQSSLSFLLAHAWDHQWWLAHLVFAGGFLILSFGVIQAFHTTGAFATVYSQAELMRQLEMANARLARQAATDPLTEAANRRYLFKRFAEELARAERDATPLSLLALDIDHFKQINDRYGHAAGDLALVTLVCRIREQLRESDLLGRTGGEEFCVLLPGQESKGAQRVAERIRRLMDEAPLHYGGESIAVRVSIGVAQFGADGEGIEPLMRAADQRLYRAKAEGRNRVVAE